MIKTKLSFLLFFLMTPLYPTVKLEQINRHSSQTHVQNSIPTEEVEKAQRFKKHEFTVQEGICYSGLILAFAAFIVCAMEE